ncbi:efflux RND transporter periplasmic adaptor subunit [Campylobacter mucosalis]|uniref:efflux RND transporter periplasmic adaptor subunit n=1 Tax=Campylobacter mucosalis TaxID=202 RepID=UPI0014700532|nr:efflux RND transporter periplasmic adaptor subunit [Campylobacter mucosalis]
MRKILLFVLSFFTLNAEQIYANFDVVALKSSRLVFQSSGVLEWIGVDVSSVVKKGDELARLDSKDEQIMLQNAQAELLKATSASDFSTLTFEKFKQVKDLTSAQSYDEAKFNYHKAQAELKKAKIAVDNAKYALEKKSLKAPYDGIISAKSSEVGNGVFALNSEIFQIISYPEVKISILIDEKYINSVKIGDEFKFKIADSGEKSVKISLIYPTIDQKTRKFKAEAITQGVKIGSFGEGYIVK